MTISKLKMVVRNGAILKLISKNYDDKLKAENGPEMGPFTNYKNYKREYCVSRHHGSLIEGPSVTPRTTQNYGTEGFRWGGSRTVALA